MKTLLIACAAISVLGACAGAEVNIKKITFDILPLIPIKCKQEKPVKAVAYLVGDTIRGTVYFTQNGCGQPVLVDVNITGLVTGDHGFHIHEKGDLTDGCLSLGAHYNPDKVNLSYK